MLSSPQPFQRCMGSPYLLSILLANPTGKRSYQSLLKISNGIDILVPFTGLGLRPSGFRLRSSSYDRTRRPHTQGSTFRVKDKEGINDLKSWFKMLIFLNNCQFDSKFLIRPDEVDASAVNDTRPKCSPGMRMEP